jgi:hypothetical protein
VREVAVPRPPRRERLGLLESECVGEFGHCVATEKVLLVGAGLTMAQWTYFCTAS